MKGRGGRWSIIEMLRIYFDQVTRYRVFRKYCVFSKILQHWAMLPSVFVQRWEFMKRKQERKKNDNGQERKIKEKTITIKKKEGNLYLYYRVFIKFCGFFFEDFKIFRALFSLGASVCTHTIPGK